MSDSIRDAAKDYSVSFYPDSGSITLKSRYLRPLEAGEKISRRFLISSAPNSAYSIATGYHIGEYMNEAGYPSRDNLSEIYAKSMHYMLKNDHAYGKTQDGSYNYYGTIHSQTGEPFGNGNAVYAMYGNSFSVAALNQYLTMHPESTEAAERLP